VPSGRVDGRCDDWLLGGLASLRHPRPSLERREEVDELTNHLRLFDSPLYRAPELDPLAPSLSLSLDVADVWSLAILFVRLLSRGSLPFSPSLAASERSLANGKVAAVRALCSNPPTSSPLLALPTRSSLPLSLSSSLFLLLRSALDDNRLRRLSMVDFAEQLAELSEKMDEEEERVRGREGG
jgi:serine/threonine protein kinase